MSNETTINPVVLITGSSSGIGEATASLFAERGWRVVASMRHPSNDSALSDQQGITILPLDVTNPESIKAAIAATLEKFGRLDAVINNAGYGLFGPFETASDEQIRRQFSTNVDGIFAMTRAVLPVMRRQNSGTIINVASLGGLISLPFFSLYCATKFAVVGFTESLSFELAPLGIRAKVIAPGGVATDFAGRSLAQTFAGDEHPYGDSLSKVLAAMSARRDNYSSPASIAEVIFKAATDDAGQILYLAGADAEQAFALRGNLSEEQRVEMTRQYAGLV